MSGKWVATVWTVMEWFSNVSAAFNQDAKIPSLTNVFTLEMGIHKVFDDLEIYLNFVGPVGVFFFLSSWCLIFYLQLDSWWTWTQVSYRLFPYRVLCPNGPPKWSCVPVSWSRTSSAECYFKLHMAATKVAHLSGTAEYIEKILHIMEEMKVLFEDGSSADSSALD